MPRLPGLVVKLPGDCAAKAMETIDQVMVAGWKAKQCGQDNGDVAITEIRTASKASAEYITVAEVVNNSDVAQGAKA